MPSEPNPAPGRSAIPSWIWFVAVPLILIAAYTAFETWRSERELADLSTETEYEHARAGRLLSQEQHYQDALRIVADPATKKIDLRPASADLQPVTVYWNPQMGIAVAGDMVPAINEGDILELWIKSLAGNLVGVAIFKPNDAGQILLVVPQDPRMLGDTAEALRTPILFSISEEPDGGSLIPTSPIQWTATFVP